MGALSHPGSTPGAPFAGSSVSPEGRPFSALMGTEGSVHVIGRMSSRRHWRRWRRPARGWMSAAAGGRWSYCAGSSDGMRARSGAQP